MIEFRGEETEDPKLGTIWQPYAEVTLQNLDNVIVCKMLVDSGADLTLIPTKLESILGLN